MVVVSLAPESGHGKIPATVLSRDFYHDFFSNEAKCRKPSAIRDLMEQENVNTSLLSMLAGKPNPLTFPFESLSFKVRSPLGATDDDVAEIVVEGKDLNVALQYGSTYGIPDLLQWFADLNSQVHDCAPGMSQSIMVGVGSQDLISKTFQALINPDDTILIEAPSYSGVLSVITSLKCNVLNIRSDSDGIIPSEMQVALENFPSDKPFPKLLYTVPFGANPTGMTTTLPRRLEVLRIARQYNILIMEDDPYYHIYYGSHKRPPSYLSLERTIGGDIGRVFRFDSMSKILAAGFRLGWMTAPRPIIEAVARHSGASMLNTSTMCQTIVLKLLQEWKIHGFLSHAERVASFYKHKSDKFEKALQRHLTGLAEWSRPTSGMFYWVKLNIPISKDSNVFVRETAVQNGLLFLPGTCCYFDGRQECHVRMSFSLLSEQDVEKGLIRLAELLTAEKNTVEAMKT